MELVQIRADFRRCSPDTAMTMVALQLSDFAFFRSSTEFGTVSAWDMDLDRSHSNLAFNLNGKEFGFSVRCLKD